MVIEKEIINPNPKVATIITQQDILDRIPMQYIEENEDMFGTLSQQVLTNPVRNSKWRYLFFHDSSVFRPAAMAFEKSEEENEGTAVEPSYTPYLKGSVSYIKFWTEERRRCLEGYEPIVDGEPCGVRIPGEYYFYLNYCRINLTAKNKVTGEDSEEVNFPRFCTMDYYYFKELELRENPTKFGLSIDYKQHFILAKARRKGYEQPHSEIIKTPTGDKTMGDMEVGMEVLTPTGKAKVLEVFPQGVKDVYELELFDGRKVKCGIDHLWQVFKKDKSKSVTVNTDYLLNTELKKHGAYTHFIGINEPVNFVKQKERLPIPAYTFGAILGDGNVSKQFKISGIDKELFDRVLGELKNYYDDGEYIIGGTYKANKQYKFKCTTEVREQYKQKYGTSKYANAVNPVYEELKNLELNCTSAKKYIPKIYKEASIEERYELVKGLMDTDGTIAKDGSMSFCNTSKVLVKDLQEVLYSLGISSTFRKRLDGLYIIYINSTKVLFHLTRKVNRVRPERRVRKYIPIVSIKKLDYKEESSCILIDSEDHLYLTKDFVITHNSFKNAGGATWKYTFYKDVKVAIIAETGGDALKTFEKCLNNIDFLTQYTEFGGPHIYRTYSEAQGKGAIKAGVKDKQGNEKGRKSMIFTVSLNGRPDAAAGLGCVRLIFEEAGKITNIKKAWKFAEPTLASGKLLKGIAIIFGTGGDMTKATKGFSEMFFAPDGFKLAGYKNIYEETETNEQCGWFVDDMWFKEGAVFTDEDGKVYHAIDKQGNALRWVAEIEINKSREKAKKGGKEAYGVTLTQYCKTPKEAFLVMEGNVFPTLELNARLARLRANKEFDLLGTNGHLVEEKGVVKFKADLENILEPINTYPVLPQRKDREGCIVQFEAPREINGSVPEGAYIISIDTIRMDNEGGQSLIAIYVVKTKKHAFEIGHDEIVMSYVGRPKYDPIDTANFILYKMGKYYNAKITHENDAAGKAVRDFFVKNKAFHMLMKPPSNIVEKHLTSSKTLLRKSGHSMGSRELVEIGEIYLKQWLLEKRGVNPRTGVEERNLDLIADKGLLEELIMYNRDINTDRVSALMGAIIQMKNVFNEYAKKEKESNKVINWFSERMNYTRNR